MADSAEVSSPCTGVCRMDERSGCCVGCARTLAEIAAWSTLSDEQKRRVRDALAQRKVEPVPATLQDPASRT
ncbi:MAG TPA: DUF1289 domain-containing protein [Burkholderiaceae bacterium]